MKKLFMTASVAALLIGCGGPNVRRVDPNESVTIDENIDRTDTQSTVKAMFNDLARRSDRFPNRPAVAVRVVENLTNEEYDTRMITDLLTEQLLNSDTFKFTTEQKDKKALVAEGEEQRESGLYKQDEAAKSGQWTPPKYLLTGRIKKQSKSNEDIKDNYYQFTLLLTSVEGGEIEWQKTKEIAKQRDR